MLEALNSRGWAVFKFLALRNPLLGVIQPDLG